MNEALVNRLGVIDGVKVMMTHDTYSLDGTFEIYPVLSDRTKKLLMLGVFSDYKTNSKITLHINNCDGAPLRRTSINDNSLEDAIQEITKNKKVMTLLLKQFNKDSQ
jgi:hypothetical protein